MNPMDRLPMQQVVMPPQVPQVPQAPQTTQIPSYSNDLMGLVQQAKQNPKAFEDFVRQKNPQAYQQALQIRSSANPQAMIMQMARMKGVNPNVLQMLGIM